MKISSQITIYSINEFYSDDDDITRPILEAEFANNDVSKVTFAHRQYKHPFFTEAAAQYLNVVDELIERAAEIIAQGKDEALKDFEKTNLLHKCHSFGHYETDDVVVSFAVNFYRD